MTVRSAEHSTPRMAVRRSQSACHGLTPDGRRQGRSPGARSGNGWRPVGAHHPHAEVTRWPAHHPRLLQRRWRGADAPVMNVLGEVSHPQSEILLTPSDQKRSVFLQRWRFPRGMGFAMACRMVESATRAWRATTSGRHRSRSSASASVAGAGATPATSASLRPQTTTTAVVWQGG
jgi:hypothetical protein